MSFRRTRPYYQTPLSNSKTIELPSNLLQSRPSTRYRDLSTAQTTQTNYHTVTPRPNLEPIQPKQHNMMVEERQPSRKNVLYKRLSDIKNKNDELEKYSYSKLLSKMVVLDEQGGPSHQSLEVAEKHRAISEKSCLRGRLINMDVEEGEFREPKEGRDSKSRASDWANNTNRIFKRMYVPSEKMGTSFFAEEGQKYIYINGKKTQCKRIHNFYSSQNYKTSYGKAFGRGKRAP